MSFSHLNLSAPILKNLAAEGYIAATPIQAQAIPHILEGRDLFGSAQTGTGKTAAFALPILQRLAATPIANGGQRKIRCLVLCPTRELATQIGESFRVYGQDMHLWFTVIFGGVNQNPQATALRRGVDIVVATPGRLLDLMNQRLVDLRHVNTLVLDEADRMLDMGFIHDIRKIVAEIPKQRQNLLFSATMPSEIRQLADSILRNPVTVQIAPAATAADNIDQSVYFVKKHDKPALLAHLVNDLPMARSLVFTRTKHGADRVVRHLHAYGIRAEAIHGNKSQNARERALANFRANKIPVLVATDVASRGIDIDAITHVVNYDLTHEPETYVHRIGRTARAGAAGAAVAFCDADERQNLKAIERLLRKPIPVKNNHPEYKTAAPAERRSGAARHEQRSGSAAHEQGRSGSAGHVRTQEQRQNNVRHSRTDSAPAERGVSHHARPHAPRNEAARPNEMRPKQGQHHSRRDSAPAAGPQAYTPDARPSHSSIARPAGAHSQHSPRGRSKKAHRGQFTPGRGVRQQA